MPESMKEAGYTVRFRIRSMKWRRVQKGRARGFYEGKSVYLRVVGPDGKKRDVYLGNDRESVSSKKQGVAKNHAGVSSRKTAGKNRGGSKPGQEARRADGDTRDPHDDRTRSLFESEKPTSGAEWIHKSWRR